MPNDAATVGLAIQYVKEAIARFEPRVIVDTVDAGPDPDDLSKLVISITYRIRGEAAVHGYEAVVDLEGTGRP